MPGKNVRLVRGKPLIVWSIEQALSCPEISRVVVSTDSEQIADIGRGAGAHVPFTRPSHLATDEAGKFQVWQHAVTECERTFHEAYDFVVDLDCTNPLRTVADISAAIAQFQAGRERGVDAVFTVCPARRNPYFNMVEPDSRGVLRMSKSLPKTVLRRQDAPLVCEHVGSIYVLDRQYLTRANHLLDGHTEGYDIGPEKSYDLDSELDLRIIEMLMSSDTELDT